ncbi:MAG: EAL domain-containing protein [Oscillospiraceae bacterium]|nr:EAL domain-containing protein [Oscillospiraceae bacterium]
MSVHSEGNRAEPLQLTELERIGEQIPGGFFVYRAEEPLEMLYVNSAVPHIFGCETLDEFRELTGFTFRGLVYTEDFESIQSSIGKQIAESSDRRFDAVDYRIVRKDGELRWIEDYGHLAHLAGYGDVYYVFITDITDKRRAQEERFRAELELEREKRANELKASLLLGISCDIQAPMRVVTEFAEQARGHLGDPRRLQADLDAVDTAGRQLRRLVDGIADMGSASFGRVDVRLEPCSLVEQGRYVFELFRAQAEAKGITLTEDVELPDEDVLADAHRLRSVLGNLIGNALSFTPPGGTVSVSAHQRQAAENGSFQLELTVADNGVGMTDEVNVRVQRALEEDDSLDTDGNARGLITAKRLLSAMGGTLSVESGAGQGTTVSVCLPLRLAAHNRRLQFDSVFDLFSLLAGEEPVFLYDLQTQATRFSPAVLSVIGLPADQLYDAAGLYFWADYIHPDDRERFMRTLWNAAELSVASFDLNCRMRVKNGGYYLIRFLGSVAKDTEGNPDFLGLVLKNADLAELADPVTGLPNLHRFRLALQQKAERPQSALMVRLGMLERVNALYGCHCGSEVVRQAGELLQNAVGGKGSVYHTGAAEFVILSDELDEENMSMIYDWLRTALHERIEVEGVAHRLNVFGSLLQRSSERELSDGEIYVYLHIACDESEHKLHGALSVLSEGPSDAISSPEVIREIRRCMEKDFENFFLLYQPVFVPGNPKPTGAEALLRWRSDTFGEIKPSAFLSEIENEDGFRELGYWVLHSAMADGTLYLRADPAFTVCVNVSPEQAADPYFAERVASFAEETGFPLDHLRLEVSRECHSMDVETLRDFAEPLRALGIKLGIDDFGGGGAWLSALRAFRPHYVKFSEDYTHGIARNKADRDLLRILSKLAADNNAEVYFKAVESEETAEALADLTVQGAQGWFYSEALYFDEILEWMDPANG